MGTTFKYAPRRWSTESGDSPPGGERPTDSVAAEDIFDDPNILSELNEANASLVARHDAVPWRPVPARLPPVDAFDLDEACRTSESEEAHRAKSLAHRLGPPGHDPAPKRSRWRFNKASKPQEDPGDTEWPTPPYSKAPRASRRAFFWGFCTSLAIVVAAPVVFGIVGPRTSHRRRRSATSATTTTGLAPPSRHKTTWQPGPKLPIASRTRPW